MQHLFEQPRADALPPVGFRNRDLGDVACSGFKNYVADEAVAVECAGGCDLSGSQGKRLRERLEQVASVFDEELMSRNVEYRAKREDSRLSFPRMVLLAEGSYERYRAGLAAEGRPENQIKQPVMVSPPGAGRAPVRGCMFFDRVAIAAEV